MPNQFDRIAARVGRGLNAGPRAALASPGDFIFRLAQSYPASPGRRRVEGPVGDFGAPEPPPPPVPWYKKIPWWAYAIAGGIVLIGVIVLIVVLARPRDPDSLVAHYPLRNNTTDVTNRFSPMLLWNTPFKDGGIENNGVFIFTDIFSGSLTLTPLLSDFNFSSFSTSAAFKPAELGERPVFVAASIFGAPFLAFYLFSDGSVGLKFSTSSKVCTAPGAYRPGKWHTGMITYDGSQARLYLDGEQKCVQPVAPVSTTNSTVGTSDFRAKLTFKGIIKDLKIFDEAITP